MVVIEGVEEGRLLLRDGVAGGIKFWSCTYLIFSDMEMYNIDFVG